MEPDGIQMNESLPIPCATLAEALRLLVAQAKFAIPRAVTIVRIDRQRQMHPSDYWPKGYYIDATGPLRRLCVQIEPPRPLAGRNEPVIELRVMRPIELRKTASTWNRMPLASFDPDLEGRRYYDRITPYATVKML